MLPLVDDIEIPLLLPVWVLRDVNGLEDADVRRLLQAEALELWKDIWGDYPNSRDWSDDEAAMAVYLIATNELVGVAILSGFEVLGL